jgi:hypothetical protein
MILQGPGRHYREIAMFSKHACNYSSIFETEVPWCLNLGHACSLFRGISVPYLFYFNACLELSSMRRVTNIYQHAEIYHLTV